MHPLLARLSLLLRSLATLLAEVLSPTACAACDARMPRSAIFCASCQSSLTETDGPDTTRGWAGLWFGGAIAVALRRLKYESRPDLAGPLGQLLCTVIHRAGIRADVVVPVPLHPKRLAERGYNQAALLGRAAARALSIPLAARALTRIRHTPQQAHLGRRARLGNVASAFQVRDTAAVRGLRVLLIDDVVTTGSTLRACSEALMAAGAASVQWLAVARARPAAQCGSDSFSDEAPC